MYLLGFDIGTTSVKASLVDERTSRCVATVRYPKEENQVLAKKAGWAEQDPEMWWNSVKQATADVMRPFGVAAADISAIGISYQMHGLVLLDKNGKTLRPAIIWSDSRAVPYGKKAFEELGEEFCLQHLLGSPGNFTASKLAWVRENEPEIFERIHKFILPGDYVAYRMTGEVNTTLCGLSEMMLWDYKERRISDELVRYFEIDSSTIPETVPTFGYQGELSAKAADELGLRPGTPLCYRAGDQPNNAVSLNVFNPGEVASFTSASGVVYGVLDEVRYDEKSRVNTFAHANYTMNDTRLAALLCLNGVGTLHSWVRRNLAGEGITFPMLDDIAKQVPIGAEGLSILPFGNGAERILQNRQVECSMHGLNFATHTRTHLIRAAVEGIVFSIAYGMEIMEKLGMQLNTIHAANARLYQSPIFREALSCVTGATIELYNTDGSAGAARAAGMGYGVFKDQESAFAKLKKLLVVEPEEKKIPAYQEAYELWKSRMKMYE